MNNRLNLSAPWYTYVKELAELFGEDPEIDLEFDEKNMVVRLVVKNNPDKAEALYALLPEYKVFGSVAITIEVVDENEEELEETDLTSLYQIAFKGNPVLSYIDSRNTPFGQMCYVVFQKKVVQFFNDDMSDINGNCSTLLQNVAQDVLDSYPDVFFCTDSK